MSKKQSNCRKDRKTTSQEGEHISLIADHASLTKSIKACLDMNE
jgi:hypothetical protein